MLQIVEQINCQLLFCYYHGFSTFLWHILPITFQFTQPDFWIAYKNGRLIVGYMGRVKSKDDKTKPPTDPTKSQ